LLDEGGAVNYDLSAAEIGSDHRIEIASDRFGAESADLLIARR